MVKMKESIKLIVGILIGILLGLCISVSAATLIVSNNVTYSNTNTSATNVKGALDDLYKKYNETKPLCKKATTLHTEYCESSSNSSSFYCLGTGYNYFDEITYGTIPSEVLKVGDALTCDVNGDNIYDEITERFYYVTDKNPGTTVLIYYNNVNNGKLDNDANVEYSLDSSKYTGPTKAMTYLPTTSQWKLPSPGKRNIIDQSGITKVTDFNYSGYSARLITAQEVSAACNISIAEFGLDHILDSCQFLLEGTSFSGNIAEYWLETPTGTNTAYVLNGAGVWGVTTTNQYGVRPVIEVSKHDISLK